MRGAQYLRVSRSSQSHALEAQIETIRDFAAANNISLVKTYADIGRSGVGAARRDQFRLMLAEVHARPRDFEAIVVAEPSRWGRFQDPDEAAHYEFLCRAAGVQVFYCNEHFLASDAMGVVMLRSLLRAASSEYSRRLGERVIAAQAAVTLAGGRGAGAAGYGLRRAVVDSGGAVLRTYAPGEPKPSGVGRTHLIWGPASEIDRVRLIFDMFVFQGRTAAAIAHDFNDHGFVTETGRSWNPSKVRRILESVKYVGTGQLNKRSVHRLSPRAASTIPEEINVPHALAPIVEFDVFRRAQLILRNGRISDDDLILHLTRLHKARGFLDRRLIDEAVGPGAKIYRRRFGSLREAYIRAGLAPGRRAKSDQNETTSVAALCAAPPLAPR